MKVKSLSQPCPTLSDPIVLGPTVPGQGVRRACRAEGSMEHLSPVWLLLACWLLVGSPGLWLWSSSLCMTSSPCTWLDPNFPVSWGHQTYWIRDPEYDPILTISSAQTLLPNKVTFIALGLGRSALLREEQSNPITAAAVLVRTACARTTGINQLNKGI